MPDSQAPDRFHEAWKPLPHVPPDSVAHVFLFRMRLFFDPEVGTVYRDLKRAFKGTVGNVLDVGCGLQPYRHLLPPRTQYHALEWEGSDLYFSAGTGDALYYAGTRFPFEEGTFDLVFHTAVLEHVYRLAPFLSECHRVLATGGKMFFTVPFAARNHYIPHDFWRLTPASITRLLQEADFTDIQVVPRGGDIAVAIHKVNSVFYRVTFRTIPNKCLRMVNRGFFMLLFALPVVLFTLAGHLSILLNLGSPDDPLGYTVHCKKTESRATTP
jgi:SAM-dependent methyltransferase